MDGTKPEQPKSSAFNGPISPNCSVRKTSLADRAKIPPHLPRTIHHESGRQPHRLWREKRETCEKARSEVRSSGFEVPKTSNFGLEPSPVSRGYPATAWEPDNDTMGSDRSVMFPSGSACGYREEGTVQFHWRSVQPESSHLKFSRH
jgi:hypothetical protein